MDEFRIPTEYATPPEEYQIPEEHPGSGGNTEKKKKRGVNPMLMFVFAGFLVLSMSFGFLFSNDPKENEKEDAEIVMSQEEFAAYLEEWGISCEDFLDLPQEEQYDILAQIGFGEEFGDSVKQTIKLEPTHREYTTKDVMKGGSFLVRYGDGDLNNYWMYYEDGELVKVEASFRKSEEEEEEYYIWEGDNLSEFWYYDMTLDEMIQHFEDMEYSYTLTITKLED